VYVRLAVSSNDDRRGGNQRARSRSAPLPEGHGVYGTRDTRDHHAEQGTRAAAVVHADDEPLRPKPWLYARRRMHAHPLMKRVEPLTKPR